jgi:hypothetical protein
MAGKCKSFGVYFQSRAGLCSVVAFLLICLAFLAAGIMLVWFSWPTTQEGACNRVSAPHTCLTLCGCALCTPRNNSAPFCVLENDFNHDVCVRGGSWEGGACVMVESPKDRKLFVGAMACFGFTGGVCMLFPVFIFCRACLRRLTGAADEGGEEYIRAPRPRRKRGRQLSLGGYRSSSPEPPLRAYEPPDDLGDRGDHHDDRTVLMFSEHPDHPSHPDRGASLMGDEHQRRV